MECPFWPDGLEGGAETKPPLMGPGERGNEDIPNNESKVIRPHWERSAWPYESTQ